MSAPLTAPIMLESSAVATDWFALPAFLPVPGLGSIAANAFLWKGPEPMLVDTGLAMMRDEFERAVSALIDPGDLRWIFLSHTDADHVGNLSRMLALAPDAKVLTTFLGYAKLGLMGYEIPENRVHLMEPGLSLAIGGRTVIPVRPPYYDAPETLGFFQPDEKIYFAADSFGATLPEPVETAGEIARSDLKDGMAVWSSMDAPWLTQVNRGAFERSLAMLAALEPRVLLSGHVPVAKGGGSVLIDTLREIWIAGVSEMTDPFAIERALKSAA